MKRLLARRPWLGLIVLLSSAHALPAQEAPRRVRLPETLQEVSGLYVAGPDSLWWHNDSGDTPTLYLTNADGQLLRRLELPALAHVDWEDLTADTDGHLFVGDFGNNRRRRTDLRVYRVDPVTSAAATIAFAYPEGRRHDLEAFFWHRDSLHLFTKSAIRCDDLTTYHYVLPARPGTYTAELRDSLALRKRVVTGAAIDEQTGEVVLVAYFYKRLLGFIPYSAASVFFLEDYPEGHFLQGDIHRRRISRLLATQYESVDFFDGEFVLVASERTVFIRPKAKRVRR